MRKAIAIDFDGCLCSNAYPEIGEPNWEVIYRAIKEQADGTGLILWTCREGQLLEDAVSACKNWGLVFDAVNENLPDWIESFGTQPRKVGASEYWDDKAVRLPVIESLVSEIRIEIDSLRKDVKEAWDEGEKDRCETRIDALEWMLGKLTGDAIPCSWSH